MHPSYVTEGRLGLGKWVENQKGFYRRDKLQQDRYDRLNELGMEFEKKPAATSSDRSPKSPKTKKEMLPTKFNQRLPQEKKEAAEAEDEEKQAIVPAKLDLIFRRDATDEEEDYLQNTLTEMDCQDRYLQEYYEECGAEPNLIFRRDATDEDDYLQSILTERESQERYLQDMAVSQKVFGFEKPD